MKGLLNPSEFQVFKPDWEQNFNLYVSCVHLPPPYSDNINFYRANVKTVAIGAVRHHIYRTVDVRVSPYSYGLLGDVPYDPSNSEHEKRGQLAYASATFGRLIGPTFLCIAKQVTRTG